MENNIVQKAEAFIRSEFENDHWASFSYHNLSHTESVVSHCSEIALGSGISQEEIEVLTLAAWFHDMGYSTSYSSHEEEGVRIVQQFLQQHNYPEEKIQKVQSLIISTKNEVIERTDLLEQILHDADHQSVGNKRFFKSGEALRKEINLHSGKKIKKKKWNSIQTEYLNKTIFLTAHAEQKYGGQRLKNINKIVTRSIPKVNDKPVPKLGRGIETMYKVVFRNQINLSSIADNKANMLIGINAVMLSVLITMFGGGAALGGGLTSDFKIVIPLGILLITAALAMINAVIAARPNIPKLTKYHDNLSIFFFANFIKLSKDDFVGKMDNLKTDDASIYSLLAEDIYEHGAVLNKKYLRLKVAYNIFMIGFSIALLSFVVLQIVY